MSSKTGALSPLPRDTRVEGLDRSSLEKSARALVVHARKNLREQIPFEIRIGLRRLPAIISHYVNSSLPRQFDSSEFPIVQASRRSPLRRAGAGYESQIQRSKEANISRAVALLDGTLIAPGEIFSWHRQVGPPLAYRGFKSGPELHDEKLSQGSGGGVCQIANALFYLGLMSGMEVVERHRHQLDLFADHERTVPFGCGATVFFPHRDLKLRNTLNQPLLLSLEIRDGFLCSRIRLQRKEVWLWRIRESGHGFFERPMMFSKSQIWRKNKIHRDTLSDCRVIDTEIVASNEARVMYPVNLSTQMENLNA